MWCPCAALELLVDKLKSAPTFYPLLLTAPCVIGSLLLRHGTLRLTADYLHDCHPQGNARLGLPW